MEKTLPNTFYESDITPVSKPDKDIKTVYLVSVDIKFFSEILANKTQQHKRKIHTIVTWHIYQNARLVLQQKIS